MLGIFLLFQYDEVKVKEATRCLIQLSTGNNEQLQPPWRINTLDTAKFMPATTTGSKHQVSIFCFFYFYFHLKTMWKLLKW